MDYLKSNHLSILIIVFLVASSVMGGSQTFGAFERTTVGNPWTFGSTVTVTGAVTQSSTLAVTATTTLSDTVNFNNPGICINFYATSTATRLRMVASTTATIEGVDGVMMMEYGACAL